MTAPDPDRPRVVVANRANHGVLAWMGKLYAFAAAIGVIVVFIACVIVYRSVANKMVATPDFRHYAQIAPGVSRIYAADGTVMGDFAKEWRQITPYDQIPPKLIDAVLAIEDHDYWSHGGIYFKGIARAVWANLTAADFVQGGSTITQQVAKQFLGSEKSISRKLKEAILARRLERQYSKKAILAVYLNQIALGPHEFGVAAAAERYFGKHLDQLTLAEMALIAGLAQAPSAYSPVTHPDRAIARRNMVLDAMEKYEVATHDEVAKAKAEPLTLHPYKDVFPDVAPWYAEHVRRYVEQKYGEDKLMTGGLRIETAEEPAFDAAAYENVDYGAHKQDKRQGWRGPEWHLEGAARDTFIARQKALYGDGPLTPRRRYLALVDKVTSDDVKLILGARTLDLPLRNMTWAAPWCAKCDADNDQEIGDAHRALKSGDVVWVQRELRTRGKFRDWGLPDGHNPAWEASNDDHAWDDAHVDTVVLDQVPHPQGALFTGDHRTGYVPAEVGGYDFGRSVFDRSYQACRQPGSTYKPIYYSYALDQGYGYDSMFGDTAIAQVDPVTGETWMPSDYGGNDNVDVTLEYALVYSKNQPSSEIFNELGAKNVMAWARRLGFTSDIIPDRALALGASCTYMPEMARAFAIFARNGRGLDWVYVRRVLDRDGNALEDHTVYYDPQLRADERLDRLAATAGVRPKQAISARTGYLTSKLLRTVIQFGFSNVVRATDIPAAGKTGTSSATMDTHFIAYSSRFITAVWLGDDLRQRPLGKKDAAFMIVEPLWARYMYETTRGYPNTEIPWEVPPGVKKDDRGDQTRGRRGEPMDLVYHKPDKPDDTPPPDDGGGGATPDKGGAGG